MKNLDISKENYVYLINNLMFNEAKKEKEIFELWGKGYNNCDIAKITGYTEGTIRNRKKKLEEKIRIYLNNEETLKEYYAVYIHIFPNKKVYVGMSKNIQKRWNNGLGYKNNERMFEDILLYGWNNIKHIIIENNLTFDEAHKLENENIKKYESYKTEKGYNTSYIKGEIK